jgi:large subunit ribosomal protein L5
MSKTASSAPRLKATLQSSIVPEMMKKFSLNNPNEVPRLVKVVINMGVNEAKEDIKAMDQATSDLTAIAGQKPQVRRAKKSISNFKLRAGMAIGLRVTLRGTRMYEFLDRFINTAIPRIRDFRGLDPRAFDGRGNYNLGLNEQHIFPEVEMDKSPKVRGLNVTIVTDAGEDPQARELLTLCGMPFKTPEKEAANKAAHKAAAKAAAAAAAKV